MEGIEKDVSLLKHKLGSFSAYISSQIIEFKNDIEKIEKAVSEQKKVKKRSPPKKKDESKVTDEKDKKEQIVKVTDPQQEQIVKTPDPQQEQIIKSSDIQQEEQITKVNDKIKIIDKPTTATRKSRGSKNTPVSANTSTPSKTTTTTTDETPKKRVRKTK